MNDLYITPDEVLEYDIKGHKFEFSPITVQEYMEHANLFANFEKLNTPQQDKFRNFVAGKIVRVDDTKFEAKQIHVMRPKIFFEVVSKMVEQLNLKDEDSTFHTSQ